MTQTPPENAPSWRSLALEVLPAFIVSRVVLLACVALVAALPLPWARTTYAQDPWLSGLTGHDAVYFLGIAAEGYHRLPVSGAYTDWVFFPLYPALTRLVAQILPGNVAPAGVLVANGALFAALLLIARLTPGPKRVRQALAWLLVLAPGAVAFGLAYSDSLYLAVSAGAITAARSRRHGLMALAYAGATLCRAPGILLGVPLLLELLTVPGRRLRPVVGLLAGPLALLCFAGYQGLVLGDPLAFVHGQAAWNIAPAVSAGGGTGASTAPGGGIADWYVGALVAILVFTLLGYTAVLPGLLRRRIPPGEKAVALVAFASVFISGRIQSDGRYLAVGWPFATHAAMARNGWLAIALALSAVGFVVCALLNVSQLLAP